MTSNVFLADPRPFRNDVARKAEFVLPADANKELKDAIGVWSMSQIGLSKRIVRMKNSVLIRKYNWVAVSH